MSLPKYQVHDETSQVSSDFYNFISVILMICEKNQVEVHGDALNWNIV